MPPENDQGTTESIQRTETGEIKDQSQTTTETKKETLPSTDTTKDVPKPEEKAESKDKPSLLNDKGKGAATGAPEKYTDFTVPEGFTLDEAVKTEVTGLFKDMNLSQDQGQKLVDFYTAKTLEAAEAPVKLWLETQEKWQAEMKSDPEIGSKLPLVKETISKAIDGLGDAKLAKEFRESMDFTGAGNNLAFAKVIYKLAQKVTEGTHVSAGGPSKFGQSRPGSQPESAARAIYPNLP